MSAKIRFEKSTNLTLSGRRSDGNAKREKSSEHNLHIGASAGMSAPDFAVCADYSNCADGLWENHSSELVSEQTVEGRTGGVGTHQHLFG